MSSDRPTPPAKLPEELVETLEEYPAPILSQVANYATELVEYRESQDRSDHDDESTDESSADDQRDLPSDVPEKATLTIKEINENRYYYWQWRDGEKIKSQYEGPVSTDS